MQVCEGFLVSTMKACQGTDCYEQKCECEEVNKPPWLECTAWKGEQAQLSCNMAAERTCLVKREDSGSRGPHSCMLGCLPRDSEAGYWVLAAAQMKGEPEARPGEEQEEGTGQRSIEK